MTRKPKRPTGLLYSLILGIIILGVSTVSYAGNKALGVAGETGYTLVKNVEKNYLTTEEGRFYVPDQTKIYDQNAAVIKLSDIHKNNLVDIRYVRINGDLTAIDINAKLESNKAELPK